ncbi:unnamed protein product [Strongylus vulgaris]|uniref:Succinate dehydogenase/fumarate reductase N-terminal domain-containing protein n=1 Tax=Strongylus vulgaris TaxID=40348 RepID=A0A3P7KP44_STRVU|nr:unnamed protein product [Strongylus vulgaris]
MYMSFGKKPHYMKLLEIPEIYYDKNRKIFRALCALAWIIDSRDDYARERLHRMHDAYSAYKCHTIMNCTKTCPKHLNPAKAIGEIKSLLTGFRDKPAPEQPRA